MFVLFPLKTPEKTSWVLLWKRVYTNIRQRVDTNWRNMSYNINNITSLTNHWQKAGPIHSLAWTPQSIHTAFFWWRFFLPIWQGQKHQTDQFGMCAVCAYVASFFASVFSFFLSYLEHIKLSALVRIPNREHVDQVRLRSVHFKHPALDLNVRKEQIYLFGRKIRVWLHFL